MKKEEAIEQSLKYFGGDALAAGVFVDKYALTTPDGDVLEATPDDMHKRMAKEFARIESKYPNPMSEKEIYELLREFKYIIPQGSPMSGIGNVYQNVSLSNCFVIKGPEDSYSGILRADQEQVQIMKRRGGVGFDISSIRPRGLKTSNAAKTTDGIGVFMERFSNSCREVAQGGRRGALMLSISVHHPEVETFINIKRDLKKVTGANISIRLTDEFMSAVEKGEDVELRFPVDSASPKISKKVSATHIWNQIIDSAHASAEPGLLFWDTINRTTPTHCYPEFVSESTNPCQPKWATVLTPEGIRTFDQVKVGSTIWSGSRWTKVVNKMATGVKPVYAYKTRAGIFYGTENHRVISGGEKIEARDADTIDVSIGKLSTEQRQESLDPQDIMDGLVWGDGMTHKASNLTVLLVGKNDQCYFDSEIKHLFVEPRPGITEEAWLVKTDNQCLPKTYERALHPDFIYNSSPKKLRGFLRGLYSANGSIVANRITFKSSCLKLVEQVQEMLSSLGIQSYYTTNKAHDVEFANGTYECRESYDLNIGTKASRQAFSELVGFIHPDKQKRMAATLDCGPSSKGPKTTYEITEKQFLGEEQVYDITVDAEEHTYWTGGLLVSNCGEIVLSPYDSCRLLLLNVLSFVTNPFTESATFNFEKFAEVSQKAQRLMDDMIDLELECVDKILQKIDSDPEDEETKRVEKNLWLKIKNVCANGRRTGTGVTAIGDAVAAMNLTYGSDASVAFVESVYKTLTTNCYISTIQMAKERGAFPVFDYEKEKGHAFLNQVIGASDKAKWKKYGRRNIALTTTAPAGSVSCLTQTTSGIEPAFEVVYKRRRKIMDQTSRVDFVDAMGDKWEEYNVYHHQYKKWMALSGKSAIEESPYWKSCANDIDWVSKVKIQAAAQKWICHSISNTTNLPKDISVDVVKQIYMSGWKSGCKGITIYRDGCRDGVLSTESHSPTTVESILDVHAPKRPKELPCEVVTTTVNREKWTFFVGTMNGKPYEIMGGLSKYVTIPKRVKSGKIVKNSGDHPRYDFHFDFESPESETVIKDISEMFENATNASFTRTVSLALRHGVPVQYLVEQLLKGSEKEDDLFSFSRAVSRVLKSYIKDGTKAGSKKCPNCNSTNLAYQEGCLTCLDCGHSKCG